MPPTATHYCDLSGTWALSTCSAPALLALIFQGFEHVKWFFEVMEIQQYQLKNSQNLKKEVITGQALYRQVPARKKMSYLQLCHQLSTWESNNKCPLCILAFYT